MRGSTKASDATCQDTSKRRLQTLEALAFTAPAGGRCNSLSYLGCGIDPFLIVVPCVVKGVEEAAASGFQNDVAESMHHLKEAWSRNHWSLEEMSEDSTSQLLSALTKRVVARLVNLVDLLAVCHRTRLKLMHEVRTEHRIELYLPSRYSSAYGLYHMSSSCQAHLLLSSTVV